MKKRSFQLLLTAAVMVVTLAFTAASSWAALTVKVMPNGVSSPGAIWDSRPYTWPGNALELWGNVTYDGSKALTYTWTFGDATPNATGSVSNAKNIAVTHTYTSPVSYIATLTVSETGSGVLQTDTKSVYIDVVPQTQTVRKSLAIQRGLKYLYMYNASGGAGTTCTEANWDSNTAYTGMAVLAFEDHGHRAMNPYDQDIYAETVQRGLTYLFKRMVGEVASSNPTGTANGISDINGNGRRVHAGTGDMYYNGIVAMAVANTADPTKTVACGSAEVVGKTYKTVLADMVDYIAMAQEDRPGYGGAMGGWRYSPNYGSSDNSVSQWPVLGLASAAGDPFNLLPPPYVKSLMTNWINYSQCSNGGFGYTWSCEYPNIAKTGSGIIQMTYAGAGGNLTNALSFINSTWATGNDGWLYNANLGSHYAMYSIKKGLQYAGVKFVGAHDWQDEYDKWYIANQQASGTWGGDYWFGGSMPASFGLLVLAPGLVELPPVANAGVDQEVQPGKPVNFDGSLSHHTDSTKSIALYEWDFNYNGTTFNAAVSGVSSSATFDAGYTLPAGQATKIFTAALRVTDNSSPARTAIDTAAITVSNNNAAPVANPGGPYLGSVGADITLDASGSYDSNSQFGSNPLVNSLTASGFDEIVKYEWDLNGDGVYGDAVGKNPTINFGTFVGTKTIGLKVTDSFGKTAAQSSQATTVAFTDLQPLCYVNTKNVYNRLTGKWTVGWKLKLQNIGTGTASNVKATVTGTSIPAGVTVIDGTMAWAAPIDGGVTQLSNDEFSYSYARGTVNLSSITWDIELTNALGTTHLIRNIPQGSGTCP